MQQPAQRSSLSELLRITGIGIESIPRGVRLYLLLLTSIGLLVTMPDIPSKLRSAVLPLALSSTLGIGDVKVLRIAPEPQAEGSFVISLSYRLHNVQAREDWRHDDACVNARQGFVRAGTRRIRIATEPTLFWDSLDGVNAHGLERRGVDCTRDAHPAEADVQFLQQDYPPGDDLLFVGVIVPEGDHWRTAPGWGVARESDPRDLVRAAQGYIYNLLSDVVICLLCYVVMGMVLFYGRENRLVRWGAARPQPLSSTDG